MQQFFKLDQDSIAPDAKIFTNRYKALDIIPPGGSYLEVGVLAGDYSEIVINRLSPSRVTLADTYEDQDWFTGERFGYGQQLEFVKNRFINHPEVEYLSGDSKITLPTLNTQYDYIYIDGGHDYETVYADLVNASTLLSPEGIIGLNDYMMVNHRYPEVEFGIVYAVNRFLHYYTNFKVVALAFNEDNMYDIYLQCK